MNGFGCYKEKEVLDALRMGNLNHSLLDHAKTCDACADLILVSQFLRGEIDDTCITEMPDASLIWRKVHLRLRREALTRATWPIRLVRSLAALASSVALLWVIIGFTRLPSWIFGLPIYWFPSGRILNGQLAEVAMAGAACMVICGLLGAFYILRADAGAVVDRRLPS